MGLTVERRLLLGAKWRGLAIATMRTVGGGDVKPLHRLAIEAQEWVSPLDDRSDAYCLFALSRLTLSYAKASRTARRNLRGPALNTLALLVLELLPEPPGELTSLPFRADLDG